MTTSSTIAIRRPEHYVSGADRVAVRFARILVLWAEHRAEARDLRHERHVAEWERELALAANEHRALRMRLLIGR